MPHKNNVKIFIIPFSQDEVLTHSPSQICIRQTGPVFHTWGYSARPQPSPSVKQIFYCESHPEDQGSEYHMTSKYYKNNDINNEIDKSSKQAQVFSNL